MKTTLAVFAALASLGFSTVLYPVVHSARIGTAPYFLVDEAPGAGCPMEVKYGKADQINANTTTEFGNFGIEGKMPFSEIETNNMTCTGDKNNTAYMAVLSNDELNRFWKTNPLGLSAEAKVKVVVAGFDTQKRVCKEFTYPMELIYLFTQEIGVYIDALSSKGLVLDEKKMGQLSGDTWYISFQGPQGEKPCVYINGNSVAYQKSLTETPEPEPEVPVPASPTPGANVPPALDPAAASEGVIGASPEGSAAPSAERVCFPSSATVELADGSVKTMDTVELGDRVKVADGSYSEVFMFSHKMSDVKYEFVNIKTASGELALTAGHYMYVNGNLVPAGTIKVGDSVESASGEHLAVQVVSRKVLSGLFNPQTEHGDIVVNGFRASTYTTTVLPSAAHALLAPVRGAYTGFGLTASFLDAGMDALRSGVSAILS